MIRLTALTKVLTEAAESKLDEFQNQMMTNDYDPEDEYWENLGLPNPNKRDTNDNDKKSFDDVQKGIEFVDEDFDTVESIALVKPSRIDLILQTEEGSEVFMESGKSFSARETPEEIEQLIAQGK